MTERTSSDQTLPDRIKGLRAAARATLLLERALVVFLPLFLIVGLFLVVALLDLLPLLGVWGHSVALGVFGVVGLFALLLGGRHFRWPDSHQRDRLVEGEGGHRPASAADDRPATDLDPLAAALWDREKQRQAEQRSRLRASLPRPVQAAADRFGLRLMLILSIGISMVWAGPDMGRNLVQSVSPGLSLASLRGPLLLDLYITPPAYTQRAPIYLREDLSIPIPDRDRENQRSLSVPVGSTVTARLATEGRSIRAEVRAGLDRFPFEGADAGGAEATGVLDGGTQLQVEVRGRTAALWPLRVTRDLPPFVDFEGGIQTTPQHAMGIVWRATDEFGVEGLRLRLMLSDSDLTPGLDSTPFEVSMTLGPPVPGEISGQEFFDLTAHLWAGRQVTGSLIATDALGQEGRSRPLVFTLPEREFSHPIARAVIDLRKLLTTQPQQVPVVWESLGQLSDRPDLFGGDFTVHLALGTAARRLALAARPDGDDFTLPSETVLSVSDLLWVTAIRIEDGQIGIAERNLRQAREDLADALANDASAEEIAALTEALRRAMDEYFEARNDALRQLLESGDLEIAVLPPGLADQLMRESELQAMVDRLQELAETGSRDAAEDLLGQLDRMLETMDRPMVRMEAGQNQLSEALELMEQLETLMQAQQSLQDQTFGRSQEPGGTDPNGASQPSDDLQALQEALRRGLGDLMRDMGEMTGEVPEPFGSAEQAMRRSEQALGREDPEGALRAQGEALDELSEGLGGLAEQLLERMSRQMGFNGEGTGQPGAPGRPGGPNTDPLGRQTGNTGDTSEQGVDVPSARGVQQAREILNELRRRASQWERPAEELDYIRRLLEQF